MHNSKDRALPGAKLETGQSEGIVFMQLMSSGLLALLPGMLCNIL